MGTALRRRPWNRTRALDRNSDDDDDDSDPTVWSSRTGNWINGRRAVQRTFNTREQRSRYEVKPPPPPRWGEKTLQRFYVAVRSRISCVGLSIERSVVLLSVRYYCSARNGSWSVDICVLYIRDGDDDRNATILCSFKCVFRSIPPTDPPPDRQHQYFEWRSPPVQSLGWVISAERQVQLLPIRFQCFYN